MRYRIDNRGWFGWVVQMWYDTEWVDITRMYLTEAEAVKVKEALEA